MPEFSCLPSRFHIDLQAAILEEENETILLLLMRCCMSSPAGDPLSNFLETHGKTNLTFKLKCVLHLTCFITK